MRGKNARAAKTAQAPKVPLSSLGYLTCLLKGKHFTAVLFTQYHITNKSTAIQPANNTKSGYKSCITPTSLMH